MQDALNASAGTSRGSQLLEEFLDVAPELAQLSDGVEAQFWATVSLLAHSWECLLDHIDARDNKVRSDVVRGLRTLYSIHCETNVPVACGLLIVALNIEASSLYDEDARLVRSLTTLHLANARTAFPNPAA